MRRSLIRRRIAATVVIAAVLALVAACGSSAPTPNPQDSAPPPSLIGTPAGAAVTKVIGDAGGTVSSGDGRLVLTIPAGALPHDTTIGIQPIHNSAAGGLGLAYRISPAGPTLTRPVALVIGYTDADLVGTAPEALGLAAQDGNGRWQWQSTIALDSTEKRLSVQTTQFGDWSAATGLRLLPNNAAVAMKSHLDVIATTCLQRGDDQVVYLRYTCGDVTGDLAPYIAVRADTWSVGGTAGGTATDGTVKSDGTSATYTAPAAKPGSAVSVSVQATVGSATATLRTPVTIVSGYHVVGVFRQDDSALVCAGTVASSVSDTVDFWLTPATDGSFTVTNIVNTSTSYGTPKLSGTAQRVTVTTSPDVLFAKRGTVTTTGGNLLTVTVDGTSTIGGCRAGGSVLGDARTTDAETGLAFYTNAFVGGKQENIPEDTGFLPWTWVVTQR